MKKKAKPPRRLPSSFGVAVVGSTTLDEVRVSGRRFFKMGGVTTYAGLTYVRSGIPTRIVTNVGEDSTWMMERMQREGIAPYFNTNGVTTIFVNIVDGEKRTQKALSVAIPILYDQITRVMDDVDMFHLGPLLPGDLDPGVAPALENKGFFIALDIQGYVRRIEEERIRPEVSLLLPEALRIASVVKGDREEMALVLDFFNCDMDRLLADFRIREAVVTEGHKGGFIQNHHGSVFRFPGVPIPCPCDPTGAGDVFFAAYLLQRRYKGVDVPNAARIAGETAARQVAGMHIGAETLSLGN